MLAAGQLVERYHVEAVVGQGGMAVVYRVRHITLGSLHALKILSVPRPQIRERLLQEGRAQAGIHHPNVVSVTDVLDIDGAPALLMEYVDGPTLDDWLQRNRATLAEAEGLFRGICEGVGEAHAHGVVHRDLKPANVLLSHARNGFVPKVTDFGIAKVIASDELSSTRTNVAMGTPHYMAPEQIRDAKNVDARADIFSLGCLLYELVCGRRPFDGPDVLELLNAVALGRYLPPEALVPGLPERVTNAIEGALRVDRDQRIQDCASLLAVLAGTAVPTPRREGPEPMLVDPISERPGVMAPLSQTYRAPDTPTASWSGDEHRVRPGSTTPVPPIDPNARTQPAVQRVEGPKRKAPTAVAPLFSAGLLGIALGMLALFGITLAGARAMIRPDSDAAVLGAAKSRPTADPELPAPAEFLPADEPRSPGARPRTPPSVTVGSPWRATDVKPSPSSPAPASSALTRGFFESPRATGRVVVTGDARSVSLVGPDGPHAPGDVPPGRYRVEVGFGNAKLKSELEIEVHGGETIVVACVSRATGCTIQR